MLAAVLMTVDFPGRQTGTPRWPLAPSAASALGFPALAVLALSLAASCGGDDAGLEETGDSSSTGPEALDTEQMYRACREARTEEACGAVENIHYRLSSDPDVPAVDACSWVPFPSMAPGEECWTRRGYCTILFEDGGDDDFYYAWDGERLFQFPHSGYNSPFPPLTEEEATRPDSSERLRLQNILQDGSECE